ncbi:hypothetical protein [Amycolatopsis benzoatilytica]|uniref:hypothetical protein n=1 Tax=Amycolatopsis benzoatilytica TaxID=346045 RepID=UPI00037FE31F|nr:hypothetical protein [Amycolatopsis benzoatilytica]
MRLVRLGQQPSRVAEDVRAALASLGRGSTVIGGVALVGARPTGDRAVEAVVVLPAGVLIVIGVDLPDPALRLEAPLSGSWKADGWPLVHGDDVNPATEALDLSQECERRIAELGGGPVGTIVAVGPYVETVEQPPGDLAGPVRVLHPTPTTMLAATVSLATARHPRSVDQARALIAALAPDAPELSDEVLRGEGFVRFADDVPPPPLPRSRADGLGVAGTGAAGSAAGFAAGTGGRPAGAGAPAPGATVASGVAVAGGAAALGSGIAALGGAAGNTGSAGAAGSGGAAASDSARGQDPGWKAVPARPATAVTGAAAAAVAQQSGAATAERSGMVTAERSGMVTAEQSGTVEAERSDTAEAQSSSTVEAQRSDAAETQSSSAAVTERSGAVETVAAGSDASGSSAPGSSGGSTGAASPSALAAALDSAAPPARSEAPSIELDALSEATTESAEPPAAPTDKMPSPTKPAGRGRALGAVPPIAPVRVPGQGSQPRGAVQPGSPPSPPAQPARPGPSPVPAARPVSPSRPGPPTPVPRPAPAPSAAGGSAQAAAASGAAVGGAAAAAGSTAASGGATGSAPGGASGNGKSSTVKWVPLAAIVLLVILIVSAIVVATSGDSNDTAASPASSAPATNPAASPPPSSAASSAPPAPSLSFQPIANSSDQKCASHAFGDVQASLQQTSCSAVRRASYTALVDGRAAAVTVAVVEFPNAAQAANFKQLADNPGGGGILDIAAESNKWPSGTPKFDSSAYASKIDGNGVRLVQAVWQPGPSTPDDPGLVRAAKGALDLQLPS